MNAKDYKERFLFIPIICAVIIYLSVACRIISLTGFLNTDFKRLDKHAFKRETSIVTDTQIKHPMMPKIKNDGIGNLEINSATAEEFDALPEIGAKRANAIVAQRTKMGGFVTLRDIMCADGLGAETFEKIEPYLKICE